MAMSKGQMLACGAGGIFVLAAGALGWLLFDAYTTRTEAEEERDDEVAQFRKYNSAAVFPSLKTIAAVNTNTAAFAAWRATAETFAAGGDKVFPMDEAPSAFKQRLTSEVRRIGNLPGGAEGKLAAAGFFFGFEKYLGESAVLPETKDLATLTVQLDAITHFAEVFADAGVLEVKAVKRLESAAATEDEEDSSRKNTKKKGRKGKDADEDEAAKVTSLDYALTLMARPSAFVEVLNALAQDKRFIVVTKFAFRSSADSVVDKLNAVEAALAKKDEPQRGRRRRRFQEEAQPEPTAPKGDDRLVVDPELDAPVQIDMTLKVYDFGRAAAPAAEGETAAPAAGEKKEAK